jgi:hypothetical protein
MRAALGLGRRWPELGLLVIGLVHRCVIFLHFRGALLHLAAQVPGFDVMQLLPIPIYQKHFWLGLWLLQQTPPVPHILFRLVLLAGGWPARTTEILCLMNGGISTLTACILCMIIRNATSSNVLGFLVSLWLLVSTDMLVAEYDFFGQIFYEQLGMLLLVACCWQAAKMARTSTGRESGRPVATGVLAALAVLTRSSLSFYPFALAPAGALIWRRRSFALFLAPLLLICGCWTLKNIVSLRRMGLETSSWSGMNMAKGIFWAGQGNMLCHDIANSPAADYPPWFQAASRACVFPFYVTRTAELPAELKASDDAMAARFGGTRPDFNMPSLAAASDAWRRAVIRFSISHPDLLAERLAKSYVFLWQRIADQGALYPWDVFYVVPVDRDLMDLSGRGFGEKQRVAVTATMPRAEGRKAVFGTISLAPLDAFLLIALHSLLPIALLIDAYRRLRGWRRFLPGGTTVLLATSLYGLVVFSVAEGGENMRFRLTVEPVLIALAVNAVFALVKAAMAAAARGRG